MTRIPSRPQGGFFFALILACLAALVTAAPAATLLPNGKQTFLDQNGSPLSQGTVQFFVPGTTTPKATWQNSGQSILNTNPVALDSSGQAIIYGAGCYRQVVRDVNGNVIWDQPTCDTANAQISWGGQAGGTANAVTVSAPNFTSSDGQRVSFIATTTNTGPTTVNGINVLKDTVNGSFSLSGGEIVATNLVDLVYDQTHGAFHLVNNPVVGSSPLVSVTGGATTDLGALSSRFINITGSTTISSFGSSASLNFPFYTVTFAGADTLVNSTNLVLPFNGNLVTEAGSYAALVYKGSGVWQMLAYYPKFQVTARRSASGLICTNDATTPLTKIGVSVDSAILVAASGAGMPISATSGTIDATTTGANGLDTGALASSSWYYAYLISNGTTTSGLVSLSSTAPLLPSGYTYYMRLCSFPTDASSKFLRVMQVGGRAQYVVGGGTNTPSIPSFATGTAGTTTNPAPPTSYVAYVVRGNGKPVPPVARRVSVSANVTNNATGIAIAPNGKYGVVVLTGTITASGGSATVSGSGTKFLTELAAGIVIANSSGTVIGTVSSITSDTALTLTANAAVAVTAGPFQTQPVMPPIRIYAFANSGGSLLSTATTTDINLESDSLYYQSDDSTGRAGIVGWADTISAN